MNPATNIIYSHGLPADFNLNEEVPVRLKNLTYLYTASKRQLKILKSVPTLSAFG